MRLQTKGECLLCGKTTIKSAMAQHLLQCVPNHKPAKESQKAFLITSYAGPYWLYFEAPITATVKNLDKFLRDVWLECCGHLSQFTIGGKRIETKSMKKYSLEDVLSVGMKFSHEYDFGSTTYLDLTVLGEHSLVLTKPKGPIRILARNEPPEFICQKCKNASAEEVCGECVYDDKGFFCGACAKGHAKHEDMFLPVVNSPRMGVCGYCG